MKNPFTKGKAKAALPQKTVPFPRNEMLLMQKT